MRIALAVIIACLLLILLYPQPASGDDPYADAQGIPYEHPDTLDYTTFGKWGKNCLTHRAENAQLESLYVQAFAQWTAVANIRDCGAVASGEDILIVSNPSLPSPVVGQASWVSNGANIMRCRIDIKLAILPVVSHELAHCLGANHTSVPGMMMSPTCCHPIGWDDVLAMQSLYGPPVAVTVTPVPPTPTATPVPPTPPPTPILYRRWIVGVARD